MLLPWNSLSVGSPSLYATMPFFIWRSYTKVTHPAISQKVRLLGCVNRQPLTLCHNVFFVLLYTQLNPGASADQIRRSFKAMAMAIHPDKCSLPAAAEAFQRLSTAYNRLCKQQQN